MQNNIDIVGIHTIYVISQFDVDFHGFIIILAVQFQVLIDSIFTVDTSI